MIGDNGNVCQDIVKKFARIWSIFEEFDRRRLRGVYRAKNFRHYPANFRVPIRGAIVLKYGAKPI